jgi:SAM-dependent methyltransferase
MNGPYDQSFYDAQREGSARSARVVVPILCDVFRPSSSIDVGCGVGTWVAQFVASGVGGAMGVDGDWVRPEQLVVAPEKFRAVDLRTITAGAIGKSFDLATSFEVAEHLPPDRSDGFVELLTSLAPAVAFSAAIPGQGGTDHINEQWPSAWAARFVARGFDCYDLVRPRVWIDEDVEWWYRQNILVFVRRDAATKYPGLAGHKPVDPRAVDVVHPHQLEVVLRRPLTPKEALRYMGTEMPGEVWRGVRRRLGGEH